MKTLNLNYILISLGISMSKPTSLNSPAFWLADIKAGFIISLIALPLCLGIATASGFPPFAGLITAIVGALIVSWIGSARFTIKGPAAGLIVIALGAVVELGQGDMSKGYHQAIAVGVGAGILQLILALARTAGLGIAMSKTVVHGMLAAIGIIIVSKQVHVALGVKPEAHEAIGLIAEIPASFIDANFVVSLIGFVSLIVLLAWPKIAFGKLKLIPAHLVVLFLAVPMAVYFGLPSDAGTQFFGSTVATGSKFMVQLPDSILDGLTFPDFSAIFSLTSIKYILMFALVGSIESTLSVVAVDAIKEYKHPSDLNRDLFAVAVGNTIAAFLGGLPMISEIVRSKANVDAGAQSHRANFFHGVFLLLYVAVLTDLIQLIPLSALAAMLIVTGLRLASLKEVLHANEIGKDQLFLFSLTVVVTLLTDLLMGVAAGLIAKVVFHGIRGVGPIALFKSHISSKKQGNIWVISISGNAAFTSLLKLKKTVAAIPDKDILVQVDVSHAKLVDHTFLSGLDVVFSVRPDLKMDIVGMDTMRAVSDHPLAVRMKV